MRNKAGWVMMITFLLLISLKAVSLASPAFFKKTIPVTYRGIQVLIDGEKIYGEEPFVMDGKGIVMVPVRMVSEAVGKSVLWDGTKNMVYIGTAPYTAQKNSSNLSMRQTRNSRMISVTYRNIRIYAGGKTIKGEEPFILDHKGVVMVPIRLIAETIGKSVVWDGKTNTIKITSGSAGNVQQKTNDFVWLENMTVIRNVGPFFRQKKPFTIAAGTHNRGLGVSLTKGSAELVIRTHGKYKAIEGWLGIDDETSNTSGAFFFSIFTDNKEIPSNVEAEGGAEKIILRTPDPYYLDYKLADTEIGADKTAYFVNSDLYEKTPIFLSGPIRPASYPKYISPAATDISGALTVTIRVTWVAGEAEESIGDYPDLTAVLADFKFIK